MLFFAQAQSNGALAAYNAWMNFIKNNYTQSQQINHVLRHDDNEESRLPTAIII